MADNHPLGADIVARRHAASLDDVVDADRHVVGRGQADVANLAQPPVFLAAQIAGRRDGIWHAEDFLHRVLPAAD